MMIEVVKALPPKILEDVELKVWNITKIEGFNRKKELNARVPSLFINEHAAFNSGIPAKEAVLDKVQELLQDSDQGKQCEAIF
ncbi:hypothetical protein E9840_10895 [Tissierella creatinini]|nr:hypothetical protein E9840_10895 [Tissierella creatinini]TJX58664.1 hypothetical protein E8P77_21870 [Soehngenia saccharolytica]